MATPERHNHMCIDEYCTAIKNECDRILKAWRAGLTCNAVKHAKKQDSLYNAWQNLKEIGDEVALMAWGD